MPCVSKERHDRPRVPELGQLGPVLVSNHFPEVGDLVSQLLNFKKKNSHFFSQLLLEKEDIVTCRFTSCLNRCSVHIICNQYFAYDVFRGKQVPLSLASGTLTTWRQAGRGRKAGQGRDCWGKHRPWKLKLKMGVEPSKIGHVLNKKNCSDSWDLGFRRF